MKYENKLTELCYILGLKNVIKGDTCFKSVTPSCLDVILVSNSYCINDSFNANVGVSDCHNMVGCSLKAHAPAKVYKRISYRSYKRFDESTFVTDLKGVDFTKCLAHDLVDNQYECYNDLFVIY